MLVLEGNSSIAFSAAPPPDCYAGLKRPGMVVLSSGESHLFAANVSQLEQLRGVEKIELSPVNTVEPERRISLMRSTIHISSRMTIRPGSSSLSDEPERRISLMLPTINISSKMNTYTTFTRIPRRMNTYAIEKSEAVQNEHLRKNRVGGGVT